MNTIGKPYRLTEADRECLGLCVHEVAHALVGAICGATVEHARFTDDGQDGICTFTADSFEHDHTRYHRSLVAAAGPAAAAIFAHGDTPTARQLDTHLGEGDREELRLAALHGYTATGQQLWAALPVVRRYWRPIGALAAKMMSGHEIDHGDVLAALNITDGGGPGSAQLAMIRSGSAHGIISVTLATG